MRGDHFALAGIHLGVCRRSPGGCGVGLNRTAISSLHPVGLLIRTGTGIATSPMVFPIQGTRKLDTRAINLKLNELIRALGPALQSE